MTTWKFGVSLHQSSRPAIEAPPESHADIADRDPDRDPSDPEGGRR
jgi:hypothetical protein